VTPSSKAKTSTTLVTKPKGKKKKGQQEDQTGVAAVRNYHPLSTNVSSPILAASKRRRTKVIDDEASDDEPHELHANGYAKDGFAVSDDVDSDAFEPVKISGIKRNSARRQLSERIASDPTMDELSNEHRLIVEDFIFHAKQVCENIREGNGLRSVPFTDTILREMAIRFCGTQEELLQIPDINPEMVTRHSKPFLQLIQSSKQRYQDLVQEGNTDDDGETAMDPNHVTIITIPSDDEDEYGDLPSGAEDIGIEESSSYFNQNALGSQSFRERFSLPQPQQQQRSGRSPKTTRVAGPSRSSTSRTNNYFPRRKTDSSSRRTGGGGGRAPRKRNTDSTRNIARNTSNKQNNGAGSSFYGGGGGGISMMPT